MAPNTQSECLLSAHPLGAPRRYDRKVKARETVANRPKTPRVAVQRLSPEIVAERGWMARSGSHRGWRCLAFKLYQLGTPRWGVPAIVQQAERLVR